MIIIKAGRTYSPESIGKKEILIGGSEILEIDNTVTSSKKMEVYNAGHLIAVPGFIDQHVHITGGGGEGGFETRVPEAQLSDFIRAGITTVVGLLGTDSVTRSVEDLVAKAKALTKEGITAYALTGAYSYPSPTITGSITKDIAMIEEIIGLKIAANDHRDSAISSTELAKAGAQARLGGMFSGKSGHVTVHMGSGDLDLRPIKEAILLSNLPISLFRPTHINRKLSLCEQAMCFAKKGGLIDITCSIKSELTNLKILEMAIEREVPFKNITFSTDGFGSWSTYDTDGSLLEIGMTKIDSILTTIREILAGGYQLETALSFFTSNVAEALKLSRKKGYLREGNDADILLLDKELNLNGVIAKGKWLMKDGKILKCGTYETISE